MKVQDRDTVHNVNILSQEVLPTPFEIKSRYVAGAPTRELIRSFRAICRDILDRKDGRLLVVVGPCSIHERAGALDYARRLADLSKKVSDTLFLVMRVYFEKPRTTIGWKGFINDPKLDGSHDIALGLSSARELLLEIAEIGLPVATEALDPVTPQYLQDLISWTAVGARTTESQTHREMASGLSTPVGFKNGTDGNIQVALNAIKSVSSQHRFLGIDSEGRCAIFHTRGNPYGHLVLRGGMQPNYDAHSLKACAKALVDFGLAPVYLIDCSHGNSGKDYHNQAQVLRSCLEQRIAGNESIIGLMIESNLFEGRQDFPSEPSQLQYGLSITDACIGWDETEALLLEAHSKLLQGRP